MIVGTSTQTPGGKGRCSPSTPDGAHRLAAKPRTRRLGASERCLRRGRVVDADGRSGRRSVGRDGQSPAVGRDAALPNGGAYAGAALYTDSILELAAASGRLRWYDQVTPHDVRDYDFALPPILTRAGGRNIVIGSGKGGRVIAWDRETRRRAWTSRSASTCTTPGRSLESPSPSVPACSAGCSRRWQSRIDACSCLSSISACAAARQATRASSGVDYARRGRGRLVALDAATGRSLWTRRLPSPVFGCATAAGGVVFTTTYAGRVYALDQQTAEPSGRCRSRRE